MKTKTAKTKKPTDIKGNENKTILILDDEPALCFACKQFWESKLFVDVIFHNQGATAEAFLDSLIGSDINVDLIVLDILWKYNDSKSLKLPEGERKIQIDDEGVAVDAFNIEGAIKRMMAPKQPPLIYFSSFDNPKYLGKKGFPKYLPAGEEIDKLVDVANSLGVHLQRR
jgi:hypothetical protein